MLDTWNIMFLWGFKNVIWRLLNKKHMVKDQLLYDHVVKVWNHLGLGAMRLNCAGHTETYSRNCCRNQQYHYSHATRALWCHESPETQPPTCSGWQQRQDQSSALLVVCGENPLVTTGFRYQRFIKMFKAFLCHNVTGDSPLWKCVKLTTL